MKKTNQMTAMKIHTQILAFDPLNCKQYGNHDAH